MPYQPSSGASEIFNPLSNAIEVLRTPRGMSGVSTFSGGREGRRREEVQREEVEKEGRRENFSYALVLSISKQPSRTVAGPKQG